MLYQRVGISFSSSMIRLATSGARTLMAFSSCGPHGQPAPLPACFSMDGTLMQRPERTAMLAALEGLVVAESPSLDKARCDACADQVAELFRQRIGVTAIRHRRPDRGDHLEIRIGEGVEPIVLLCHHDTVWPEGTLARLPFRIDGDRVTGPGSYDMKAGIVEAAFALAAAKPRRPARRRRCWCWNRPPAEAPSRPPARASRISSWRSTAAPPTPASSRRKGSAPSRRWPTRCWR